MNRYWEREELLIRAYLRRERERETVMRLQQERELKHKMGAVKNQSDDKYYRTQQQVLYSAHQSPYILHDVLI